ncbi:response regulator [Nostoc sp. NIES-2111]
MTSQNCALSRSRILAVEDNDIDGFVLKLLLRKLGSQCLIAKSVAEAKKLLATETFDLVFLDAYLPDGHGADIARFLRKSGVNSAACAIGVSTDDSLENLNRFRQAGCDAFLPKPYQINALRRTANQCLPACRCCASEETSPQPVA